MPWNSFWQFFLSIALGAWLYSSGQKNRSVLPITDAVKQVAAMIAGRRAKQQDMPGPPRTTT